MAAKQNVFRCSVKCPISSLLLTPIWNDRLIGYFNNSLASRAIRKGGSQGKIVQQSLGAFFYHEEQSYLRNAVNRCVGRDQWNSLMIWLSLPGITVNTHAVSTGSVYSCADLLPPPMEFWFYLGFLFDNKTQPSQTYLQANKNCLLDH